MNEDSFLDSYYESQYDLGDWGVDDASEWETEQVYQDREWDDGGWDDHEPVNDPSMLMLRHLLPGA